jgi:hypothetical protein
MIYDKSFFAFKFLIRSLNNFFFTLITRCLTIGYIYIEKKNVYGDNLIIFMNICNDYPRYYIYF